MAKQPSPKQPTEIPDTSFKVKKFPLELVRTLQRQFDAAAQQYPHLMHVLVLNREVTATDEQLKAHFAGNHKLRDKFGNPEQYVAFVHGPRLPKLYYNEEAQLALWSDTPHHCYKVGWRLLHWLLAPGDQHWDRSGAMHTLNALAEISSHILTNLQVGKSLELSDYVALPSPFRRDIETWVLAVHEFTQPEKRYFMPTAIQAIEQYASGKPGIRADAFFEVLSDFWLGSSQVWARLLDMLTGEKAIGQFPYQNQVPWSKGDLNYYPNKEAIKDAYDIGRMHEIDNLTNLDYDHLGKLLRTPGCQIRFMSQKSPPKGKVHRCDWRRYLQHEIEQKSLRDDLVERETLNQLDQFPM